MENTENKTVTTETDAVDETEFNAAVNDAQKNNIVYFTIKFKSPVTYNKKEYSELSFDFEKLTGLDGLAIEEELQMLGKAVVVPTLSGPYLMRMAARACTEEIGVDFFNKISLREFNRIRDRARSFLLRSESN